MQRIAHLKAWEKDYGSRGRLWGGAAKSIPDLPEGSRVLELGCGSGKTLSSIQSRPWRIAALDISYEALKLCKCGSSKVNTDFVLGDARALPFKDKYFDVVFAFHVAGHLLLEERTHLASEASRVLKADGRLYFREFETMDMRAGAGEEVEAGTFRRGEGMITHYFTDEEAAKLFSSLMPESIKVHSWKMKVKGKDLLRSEVQAIFTKGNSKTQIQNEK